MTHYILVHGAWEGAWSWDLIQPVLEKAGHKVTSVDLPGSPGNKRDIVDVTMESYIDAVVDAINKAGQKIVLVGHSLAGAIISQVAERIPEKINRLIYVTAFLLANGDSIIEAMQRDPDSEFLPKLKFSDDQSYAAADEKTWRDIAFHDVRQERISSALPRVVGTKQATEPFMAKVVVSKEKFGSVPKTYIRTALDKMVSPKLQDEMLANWKVDKIHTVHSGHFPTLSLPETLAELIL